MTRRVAYSFVLALAEISAAVGFLWAQNDTGFDPLAAAQWPLDRLELKNGKVYQGVILPRLAGDAPGELRFDTVRRPPGRPMFFIGRKFREEAIANIERLSDEERAKLVERLERYRARNVEELFDMSKLDLKRGEKDAPKWTYESGPWFLLESWTDEEMTRRTIVRIEQMFTAYSEILPARSKPQRPLRIQLYGSMRDYADAQKKLNQRFENPAFYLPSLNVLVAGSELTAYARRLDEVRRKHAAIRAQYDTKAAAMPMELKKLGDDLEKKGVPSAERKATVGTALRKWKEELEEIRRRMEVTERSNNAQYAVVTKDMLTRLYHEAFHAYLENFVYPAANYDVPRWLNEGLAQVFEEGLLEVGTLRLDAPSRKRLPALHVELRSPSRLPLQDVLTADGRAFLVSHPSDAPASERHYLYSWGLAHYLVMREPILETSRLDNYVDPSKANQDPTVRFETLVGMPLAQFESKWRAEILALKAPER